MFARKIGTYELQKHRAIDHFLEEGDTFIDIGANKGDFAIHAALKVGATGRVVAFEPEPENFQWLEKGVRESGLNNVTLEKAAVGAVDGALDLILGKESGWHSFVSTKHNQNRPTLPVEVRELDGYLYANPLPRLRAIKIDVEGFEKEVLMGANRTLNGTDELALFIDVHPGHGVKRDDIYGILQSQGYSLRQEKYPFNLPLNQGTKPLAFIALKTGAS
jgi:FkbM family methyltransferase